MTYELADASADILDMRSTVETIENASYQWGAPNIELACADVKIALNKLATAIMHWSGEEMNSAESGTISAFKWLENVATPDGTSIVDIANIAQEITQSLFQAHRIYQQGDTLRALDIVNNCYHDWGATTVNALLGAMRAQLLQPGPALEPPSFPDTPTTEIPGDTPAALVESSTADA